MIIAQRQVLVAEARRRCAEQGTELLFLTIFGSRLYGTDQDGNADLDVRGIFLPSPAALALDEAPHSLHVSTGDSHRRNRSTDVDMDLYSLQHWLLHTLPTGDIAAQDLLFAPSHAACVLYMDPRLTELFAHPLRVINMRDGSACRHYCLRQAKKYGLRGSRTGAILAVLRRARELCPPSARTERLRTYLPALVAACPDSTFCRLCENADTLRLGGKTYAGSLRMTEVFQRLEREIARNGQAALAAERGEGIDWKALSHALRALYQQEAVLRHGTLTFPLTCREILRAVKAGARSWPDVETDITERLDQVERLRRHSPFAVEPDRDYARRIVLRCYGYDTTSV